MARDRRDCVPIPHPKSLPFVGNTFDLAGKDVPILALASMAAQHGEIFSLRLTGGRQIFVSSQKLLRELCDEGRFTKAVIADLAEMRNVVHDGLFTAYTGEPNWGVAHRVLVPAFGPLKIQDMYDLMKDIASQLVLKWVRYGPSYQIDVAKDFTRLTLDTLALCAMDFRFNSFYSEKVHPFVDAMMSVLKYGEQRANRPSFFRTFSRRDEEKWTRDIAYMRELSHEIVQERRANPAGSKKDFLNAMITGKDQETGETLNDTSTIDNMITFLVAGHETTSGALSFVFYYLLKHPKILKRAQQEVDEVVGKEGVQYQHMSRLPYITAILRETLRLQPTAPAFSFTPKSEQGEVIAGKYHIKHGEAAHAILHNVHRDPVVYGDKYEDFDPERMLDDSFNALPPCSWKPFGSGARACIGRAFAWQEMMLVVTMLLRYFDCALDEPNYTLRVASTLTIKPKDFFMRATPRKGWTASAIEKDIIAAMPDPPPSHQNQHTQLQTEETAPSQHPLTILYGSNSGTCEAFARALTADAVGHGFQVSTIDTLDSAKQNFPTGEPVVIITASYEGRPCDNAAQFVDWLRSLKGTDEVSTSFAVFGCGHSDWKNTFQRVPKTIDELLERNGGRRICALGSADAGKGNMNSEFQTWEDRNLWPALRRAFGEQDAEQPLRSQATVPNVVVDVVGAGAATLRPDRSQAKVLATRMLSSPGVVPEKRHIELQLPPGMEYRVGDYCAVLPQNPPEKVRAVMARFDLPGNAMLKLSSGATTSLPTEHPIPAQILFSSYVELAYPATKRDISTLAEASSDKEIRRQLVALANEDSRLSLMDLLQRFPAIRLPLGSFVSSLMTMRVRQYSISSSPLRNSDIASLTYSVLREPAISGQGMHVGVASNYLASLEVGDVVQVAIKPSHESFHLPEDVTYTPVIMIAAGAGLAPFRGFAQERAMRVTSGNELAPAFLYYGCRHPEKDDLYREEMDAWEATGAVTVQRAYSQAPERSGGRKHVDEVLLADRAALLQIWKRGAKVYVCGSREVGESVKAVVIKIAKESAKEEGEDDSEDAVNEWFKTVHNERYATDVFD